MAETHWNPLDGALDIATLRSLYASGRATPADVVRGIYARISSRGDDAVWIHVRPEADAIAAAEALESRDPSHAPLFGIPFAAKDNIDVAGMPTTAACPGYAYSPAASATAVERLEQAGAICIGKTNLDQFATGLSGTRSPYGACRCAFDNRYISGGSSSGSAVAVAAGLVTFALGTDTGGSGRVPAGFNNVVGLKPTRGLVPTTGLVPNCRTLDCVSVFALTCEDAFAAFDLMRGPDALSAFGRADADAALAGFDGGPLRFAVPREDQREFFGDDLARARYAAALERLRTMGTLVEIDLAPFVEAGRLMFDGPWVAERLQAVGPFVKAHPEALLTVTRDIILGGGRFSGVDVFGAYYRLRELKQIADAALEGVDALVVPTAATIPTVADLEAEPVQANSRLGHYSYFVNLLDLAACAVPNGFRADGLPSGITLIGAARSDLKLAQVAAAYHRRVGGELGATGHMLAGYRRLEGEDRAPFDRAPDSPKAAAAMSREAASSV